MSRFSATQSRSLLAMRRRFAFVFLCGALTLASGWLRADAANPGARWQHIKTSLFFTSGDVENLLTKPRVAERVLKQFQDLSLAGMAMESLAAPITSREMEVLGYVARGYGNKQIAHTLNICEQTIKHHITSILRKLDANDRTHAVVLAIRHGWISVAGKGELVGRQ
jgi:DNA-binding CsgD family transcriptional regulator